MSDQTPAEAAVARGMALLDAKVPGWEERIDLNEFILVDSEKCICGQLFGPLSTPYDALKVQSTSLFGFVPPPGAGWIETESVWRKEIHARRAARAVSLDAS